MKKIFSLKKFREFLYKHDCDYEDYLWAKKAWAEKCEGLTAEEIEEQFGIEVEKAWMKNESE